jgi:hypothetical protein
LIPFTPADFDSETVYDPEPKPVSVYCPAVPPGAAVVVNTFTDPVPVTVTFDMNLGGAAAFAYVTVPAIDGVPPPAVGVAVAVAVLVGVDDGPQVVHIDTLSTFMSESPSGLVYVNSRACDAPSE